MSVQTQPSNRSKSQASRIKNFGLVNRFALLLVLLCLSSIVKAQLQSVRVFCDPPTIGAKKATLQVQFYPMQDLKKGQYLKVTVPEGVTLFNGNVPCSITGNQNLDGLTCSSNGTDVWYELTADVEAYQQNTYNFKGALNAPTESHDTNSFVVSIYKTKNETDLLMTVASGVFLKNLQPATIPPDNLQIYPSAGSSGTVGNFAAMQINIKTTNPIPVGGGIRIQFPKWDDKAPAPLRHSYFDEFTQCDTNIPGQTGDFKDGKCIVQKGDVVDTLIMEKYFPNGLQEGTPFQFILDQIRIPLSMSPVDLKLVTYTIAEKNVNGIYDFGGLTDQGVLKLQALMPASINPAQCEITTDDSTVSEFTNYFIRFQAPVPIQDGCTIVINFPKEDYYVEQFGALAYFNGWGIFGGNTDLNAQIDTQMKSIKLVDQCIKYSPEEMATTIKISTIQNPPSVKETESFNIVIYDSNSNVIAQTSKGLTYQPTPGSFTDIVLTSLGSQDVQALTDLSVKFTPLHGLTEKSVLKITSPLNMPIRCDIKSVSSEFKTVPYCRESEDEQGRKVLTFNEPFQTIIHDLTPLELVFSNVELTPSAKPISGLGISTYMIGTSRDNSDSDSDSTEYMVDLQLPSSNETYFAPKPVQFHYATVQTGTFDTYQDAVFTFTLTLAADIPAGGILTLTIPKEVQVTDTESASRSCKSVRKMSRDMKCYFVEQPNGDTIVNIIDSVPSYGLQANDELSFRIADGLKTPISTQTTSSFQVVFSDSEKNEINYVRKAMSITMRDGCDIGPLDVEPTSQIVGEKTTHTLLFNTPVPLTDGYYFHVIIPEQCQPPQHDDLKCSSSADGNLVEDLSCTLNGYRVQIEIKLSDKMKVQNGGPGFISPEDDIQFSIGLVGNPSSMSPSSPYSIDIRSPDLYMVAKQVTTGTPLVMSVPSTIETFGFDVLDYRQGALTTVTIEWISSQVYPQDLAVSIVFDPRQFVPKLEEDGKSVTCIINLTKIGRCVFQNMNQIIVKDLIDTTYEKGQKMTLTITNMKINVFKPLTTTSWVLTTKENDARYGIDRIDSGLTLNFKCTYPCLTCDPNDSTKCNSCNNVENFNILYENKCYQTCPDGTYQELFTCKKCDQECKTCFKDSGLLCTSCDVTSAWPYLSGNICTPDCDFGFFGNPTTGVCEPCAYPCESCFNTEDTCLSCDQQSVDKYLLGEKCKPACPDGWVAPYLANDNVCQPCDGCATCVGTTTKCETCPEPQYLSLYDDTCHDNCPADITILQGEVCKPCSAGCPTCLGELDFCTSCVEPLTLHSKDGTCVLDCDLEDKTMVTVNGECEFCNENCATCQDEPDYCLSCHDDVPFLHNNKCFKECPLKDGYQYVPNDDNLCTIPGLICKFGYSIASEGNFCIQNRQTCNNNFKLNYDKTKCIPTGKTFYPFPILITTAFLCIFPFVSKCIYGSTQLVANLIVNVSFMETIGIGVQFFLARDYGIKPTTYCTGAGFFMLLATNLFFTLVYQQQIKNDQAFKHWYAANQKTSGWIQFLGLFNFKCFRMLYDRLFGRDEFDAPLENPMVFYRPLHMSSLLTLITVMVPVIIGSIFGVYYVTWGYQLLMTCFEMLILMAVLLILEIIEYCMFRFEQKDYYKVMKRDVEVKVASGYMSDSSDDEYEIRDKLHKPKALKQVKILEHSIHVIKGKALQKQGDGNEVEREIGELHELQIMQRQFRQCRSFRLLRPNVEEGWGSDNDSDYQEEFQDFISAPATPRSKEILLNGRFVDRMHDLKRAFKMRDQYDNCYHEAKRPVRGARNNVQMKNRFQQTNILEMLGIDDLTTGGQTDYEPVSVASTKSPQQTYDDHDLPSYREKEKDTGRKSFNMPPKKAAPIVETKEKPKAKPPQPKGKGNRRPILSKERAAQVPEFELVDILGDFDQDPNQTFMLVLKRGRLHDKNGRFVNRKGYTIDKDGNVITRSGVFLFARSELDPDTDDLPDPFYEKMLKAIVQARPASAIRFRVNDGKKGSANDGKKGSENASQFNVPSLNDQSSVQAKGDQLNDETSALVSGRPQHIELKEQVRDEEDDFIKQITAPKRAKTKEELLELARTQHGATNDQPTSNRVLPDDLTYGDDYAQSVINRVRERHLGNASQEKIDAESDLRMEQLRETQSFKNLVFVNSSGQKGGKPQKTLHSNASQAAIQAVSGNKEIFPKVTHGQGILEVYKQDLNKIEQSMSNLNNDQAYLHRMEDYANKLNQKRQEYLQEQNRHSISKIRQGYMPETSAADYQGGDASGQGAISLARKNLTSVYGRVRNKYNEQIRQGGAALKFKPSKARARSPRGDQQQVQEGAPDHRMLDLESIYLHPRIAEPARRQNQNNNASQHMNEQDVTRALRDLHHMRDFNEGNNGDNDSARVNPHMRSGHGSESNKGTRGQSAPQ